MNSLLRFVAVLCWVGVMALPAAQATRVSDVKNTKHNLSTTGPGVGGNANTGTTEICVFCHTPHGANATAAPPLWNRKIGGTSNTTTTYLANYTAYSSESLDARMSSVQSGWDGKPLGSSKLCLSCHDGTIALGNVVNAPGSGLGSAISVGGAPTTTMPAGTDGYTRNLGQDLSNDHPISITYSTALTTQDGELRPLASMPPINSSHPLVGVRAGSQGSGVGRSAALTGLYGSVSTRPVLPLETTTGSSGGTGQVQCTTCHDPHITDTNLAAEGNIKFLRRNRFQLNSSPSALYSDTNDIICLACHQKGHNGTNPDSTSWAYSAHANSAVAGQAYTNPAAAARDFPAGIKVWQASCLNCHDTHTATGARRLTRLGATGGVSTLEETCYQCHSSTTILQTDGAFSVNSVPNVKSDFGLTYRMPINIASEVHDIGGSTNVHCPPAALIVDGVPRCGADGVERATLLASRHAECTDCHNPHRVVKNKLFYGTTSSVFNIATPQTEGTHRHLDSTSGTDAAFTSHTNVASGVLRGSWGVEPTYSSNSFHSSASNFIVRRGDPAGDTVPNTSAPDGKTYVTREYQVCLKCHSSYAYGATPPDLGYTGGTPSGTNGLIKYTDQAKEFQAPGTHADEPLNLGNDGGSVGYQNGNHRSWHPVMRATGRTATKRGISASSAFNHPFQNVGTQTMYCSDCHGSGTDPGTVIPTAATPKKPWGPHGSNNAFILKGEWNNDSTNATTTLCMRCHNPTSSSGFSGGGKGNLHQHHADKGKIQCTFCHIAVPHGWKNRSLLVNLNDVGEEVGLPAGSSKEVNISGGAHYTQPPYYLEAKNKIVSFATSGSWSLSNCGSADKAAGERINGMTGNYPGPYGAGTANQNSTGKDWMLTDACNTTP